MFQCVETIRIKDGEALNLAYHQQRLNRTVSHFWPELDHVDISQSLRDIPSLEGLQKARLVYDGSGVVECEYHPYRIRDVRRIKVVDDDAIDYTWKSTDRSVLTAQRDKAPDFDEVIIIRNGCVTDTSYTNLCFYDGERWLTPDTPLLLGTMRQRLLDESIIHEAHILKSDISHFEKVSLINAMMELGDLLLSVNQIDL